MWGALDVGYALRRVLSGNIGELCVSSRLDIPDNNYEETKHLKNLTITPIDISELRSTQVKSSTTSSSPLSIQESLIDLVKASQEESIEISEIKIFGIVSLLLRLLQAHIMPGWLFIMLTIARFFPISTNIEDFIFSDSHLNRLSLESTSATSLLNPELPWVLHSATWIVFFVKFSRFVPFIVVPLTVATYLLYYKVHNTAAVDRWDTTCNRNLGLRSKIISVHHMPWTMLNLLAIPGCTIFLVVPLLHAQFLHLFTPWLVFRVSLKS
jgi:hypothetical protein